MGLQQLYLAATQVIKTKAIEKSSDIVLKLTTYLKEIEVASEITDDKLKQEAAAI